MIEPKILLPQVMFYVFAVILVLSAFRVITARNSVHSVLFLILAFFNAAGLFVMLGAEFIAMLMVIVYVGAVAVLFLFIVMMLNVKFSQLQESFIKYLPLGIVVAITIFVELVVVINSGLKASLGHAVKGLPISGEITNTENIGLVLYTKYAYPFEVAGLVLLVAMVGAIVLALRKRDGVLRQNIYQQVSRNRKDCIEIVTYNKKNK